MQILLAVTKSYIWHKIICSANDFSWPLDKGVGKQKRHKVDYKDPCQSKHIQVSENLQMRQAQQDRGQIG